LRLNSSSRLEKRVGDEFCVFARSTFFLSMLRYIIE
jgi:hypothetical protein